MNQKYWIIADYPQIKTSEYLNEFKKLKKCFCYLTDEELDKIAPRTKVLEIHKVKTNI